MFAQRAILRCFRQKGCPLPSWSLRSSRRGSIGPGVQVNSSARNKGINIGFARPSKMLIHPLLHLAQTFRVFAVNALPCLTREFTLRVPPSCCPPRNRKCLLCLGNNFLIQSGITCSSVTPSSPQKAHCDHQQSPRGIRQSVGATFPGPENTRAGRAGEAWRSPFPAYQARDAPKRRPRAWPVGKFTCRDARNCHDVDGQRRRR